VFPSSLCCEIPEPYDIQLEALGTAAHLRNFASNDFDCIVIDEFHHAAARTYQRLINR
jgi:superfamily II DNA or RNA helicase